MIQILESWAPPRHRDLGAAQGTRSGAPRWLVAWGVGLLLSLVGVAQGQSQPTEVAPMGDPSLLPEAEYESAPLPRPVPPFAPEQVRLPVMGAQAEHLLPAPAPEMLADYARFVKLGDGPGTTLELFPGRPLMLNLLQTPRRLQIADEEVAQYALLSPKEVSLLGLRVGTTVLNLWFPDPANPDQLKMLSFLIRVLPDPELKNRLERAYQALEQEINHAFPDSKIHLILLGDKVGVTGQARDITEANQIIRVIQANVLRVPALRGLIPAALDPYTPVSDPRIATGAPEVINMLRVPGEQQVALQVTVAEVNRAAARSIGLNFNIFDNDGNFIVGQNTGLIGLSGSRSPFGAFASFGAGAATGGVRPFLTGLGGLANLPVAVDNGQIQLAIHALKTLSYARFLAEPVLTTMNGHTAEFHAGNSFPVPTVGGGFLNSGLQGVNFIPIGVQLNFTPYITDRDRIRLVIDAQVSERDRNVQPTLINGAAVPSLTNRHFSTTVELREGQTLAVAGLLTNKLDTDADRVPWLASIPIVGRAFGFDRTGAAEQELVILVTPQLVRPFEPKKVPPLPGSDIFEPNDLEFYLLGRLESHHGIDYRSPIRTDCDRVKQYREMEIHFLAGPHGPSVDIPYPVEMTEYYQDPSSTYLPPPVPAPPGAPTGYPNAIPADSGSIPWQ